MCWYFRCYPCRRCDSDGIPQIQSNQSQHTVNVQSVPTEKGIVLWNSKAEIGMPFTDEQF